MENFQLQPVNGEPNGEDRKVMVDGMLAYHAGKGHPRKKDVFSVLLKDDKKNLKGIIVVSFLYNGMEIDSLWVDESVRGQGWGRKLIEAVEVEGRKRACAFAYTNTFTWQAPRFYEKLGYRVYGKLENFPEGNSLTYYRKDL